MSNEGQTWRESATEATECVQWRQTGRESATSREMKVSSGGKQREPATEVAESEQ